MNLKKYLKMADSFVPGCKVVRPKSDNKEHIKVLAGFIVQHIRENGGELFQDDEDLEEQIGYWTAKSVCNERYMSHYFVRLFSKNKQWVGFLLGRVIKDRIPFANIDMLYFVPEARGDFFNGLLIGNALGKMIRWAANKNVRYVTASCSYDNPKAFLRLRSAGMQPVEVRFAASFNLQEVMEYECARSIESTGGGGSVCSFPVESHQRSKEGKAESSESGTAAASAGETAASGGKGSQRARQENYSKA